MSELESLATEEGLDRHLRRHGLDRLLMLCDGVFAIAVTLAAVEIHIPPHIPSLSAAFDAIGFQLFAYGMSFLIIAVYWLNNRDLFARLHHVDPVLTALTLALLCIVALIPASTHIIQSQDDGAINGSMRLYALTMVVSGSLNLAMWGYASFRRGLMIAAVPRSERMNRVFTSATIPVLFFIVLLVPSKQMLQWVAPIAIIIVIARRTVLPRYFPKG